MKDSTEKSIKKWLKRKVTITIGMMVAFMITGGIVYSNDTINQEVNIKIENGTIVVTPEEAGILVDSTWTNNGKIEVAEGNGVIINWEITEDKNFNLINNGVISVSNSFWGSYNGIINDGQNKVINKLINNNLINFNSLGGNRWNVGNAIFNIHDANIKEIINRGMIVGKNEYSYSNVGAGNAIFNSNAKINQIKNSGILLGESISGNFSGNGITTYTETVSDYHLISTILNNGQIIGFNNYKSDYKGIGNGIAIGIGVEGKEKIEILINTGMISGSSVGENMIQGNGIYNNKSLLEKLTNYGIISGSNQAISNDDGTITNQNNYGLLIDGAGTNNIIINAGVGGEIQETGDYFGYTVMNTFNSGTPDLGSEAQVILSENEDKLIINGYNKGLYVDNSITLSNSIINSYTSAIKIDGGNLTGDNIIVNGGVDKQYDSSNILVSQSPVIAGSINIDTLTLKGNSIINGNIDLGDGADNLIIANTVQINGELLGGNGDDTLTFNSGDTSTFALNESNINIFNNVDGFETINIATNVTFFETSQVTGANNISIKKDGNLILRIDSTNNYSNAFSNNTGTISSEGGKLLLALNGIGEGETINLGKINLDDTIKGNEIGYSSDITLDTTSLLYTLARGEGNTIKVNTVENLPVLPPIEETPEEDDVTPPIEDNNTSNIDEYNNLNSIYQSIRDNNLVKEFDITDDNKLAGFYSYLHDIYAGNPVAFSSTLSKKSSSMFSDIVMNKDLTTDINKWSIYGGFTHIDGGTKDSYYGKKDYTYNIVNKDIDVDSKISGMYALGEYGLSNNSTFGIIFGGNQEQSKLNNGSKVDGDSFYLGTYTKKYLGNLKLVAGLGYQYGDYKSDRVAIGYENIIDTKTYHSNYNDNTLSIYGQAKYSNKLAENLYLEPSVGIEYTYIDQNESSESGILGIETESKEFNYTTAKFGVDLRKDIPTSSAIHSLVAGVYYNRMLDGYDVQNIKGSFKEGNSFDILVSPSNKHELGLRAKYELSLNNGVTFDLKGSYTFAREKYNNDNKNEYKGEWLIGTGIGYKF